MFVNRKNGLSSFFLMDCPLTNVRSLDMFLPRLTGDRNMFGTSALRDDAKRWRAKAEGLPEEGVDPETWRFVCEVVARGYDEMADRHEREIRDGR